MAKIRKFVSYRGLERAYTRKSKFREKSYIKANPHSKVVRFVMGNLQKEFPYQLDLVTKQALQIRHNALESSRMYMNRMLEGKLGKTNFRCRIRIYPHHILRENPLAAGAGADRMSTGMKMSFGKPIGVAARVREGQSIFSVEVDKAGLEVAKKALSGTATKLPCQYRVVIAREPVKAPKAE
ncbi:MAG: 50S ribosomal protein L16 [archaeon]